MLALKARVGASQLFFCLLFFIGAFATTAFSACLPARGNVDEKFLLGSHPAPSILSHSSFRASARPLSLLPLFFLSPNTTHGVASFVCLSPSAFYPFSLSDYFSLSHSFSVAPFPRFTRTSTGTFLKRSHSTAFRLLPSFPLHPSLCRRSCTSYSPPFSSFAPHPPAALCSSRLSRSSIELSSPFTGDEREQRGEREECGNEREGRETRERDFFFPERQKTPDKKEVLVAPHPLLRLPSHPEADWMAKETKAIARELFAIMYRDGGIGLAAPQVGLSLQMIVWNPTGGFREVSQERVFLNPRILSLSGPLVSDVEGCLSVPGVFAPVERPMHARVRYTSLEGDQHEVNLSGLEARVVQHEIDHLHGILFVDRAKA